MTALLWRTFLAQFFASESVTSDLHLRRSMIGVLAALLPPGLFLMVQIFPTYELLARFRPDLLEPFLVRLGLIFVTYSMVVVGLIAVVVWDSLSFDRRDAMVLGPLPIRGRTIIMAKLAALATFLVGTAAAVNTVSGVPFAIVTANRFGAQAVARSFAAHFASTLAAGIFAFAAVVFIRGLVSLAGRDRSAARLGSLLQFVFVGALLSLVVVTPEIIGGDGIPFADGRSAEWIPLAWFLGLFETLRGSARTEFASLASRAVAATAIVVAGSVLVSAAGFRQQMRLALAPPPPAAHGGARLTRAIARRFAGRDRAARAATEFIVLTLARNRAVQAPAAMTAAIAFAIVVAALSRTPDMDAMLRPRTAVLWIPFMLAFWLVVGLRASFFVPSELRAAWSFRVAAPEGAGSHRRAAAAAIIAFVLPATIAVSLLMAPVVGWRFAGWSALLASATTMVLAEAAARTLTHVPFTRAYIPGHARLRTRWPLYVLGVYLCAYWPARLVLLAGDEALLALLAVVLLLSPTLRLLGRGFGPSQTESSDEDADEFSSVTVLAIGPAVAKGMHNTAT
jgi:hypothetical protein